MSQHQPGHERRRHDCSDGRAARKNTGAQCSLACRKPLGRYFRSGWPVSGLTNPEQEPESGQRPGARRQRVQKTGCRPDDHAQGISHSRAQTIEHPAGHPIRDGVGEQEGSEHVAISFVAHVKLLADCGSDN